MWKKRWELDPSGPESAKKFPLVLWMFLGCGAGLIFSVIGFFVLKSSWDVKNNWLDASAVITEKKIERYEDRDHNEFYRGVVSYEYQMGSDKFSGTYTTAGSSSPVLAEKYASGYEAGESIGIKVNPRYKYQSKALSEADDWMGNWLVLVLGLVVLVSFGGGGVLMWRKRNRGDLSIKQKNENI